MKIKQLIQDVNNVWSKQDHAHALYICCKEICELNQNQLTEAISREGGEKDFESLIRSLRNQAQKYDPRRDYETICHAILLLERTLCDYEEYSDCRSNTKHHTRAHQRRTTTNPDTGLVI